MRNLLLITAFLFISFSRLLAQQDAGSDKSFPDANQSTVHGCLNGAPSAFTLASDSGTTYELVGDSTQLSQLVGKEVDITGSKGSASGISTGVTGYTGLATSNPTAGTAPTIRVTTAKETSDHCEATKRDVH
jgi:hypothetical protein